MKHFILSLIAVLPVCLPAQDIIGVYTRYSDSFREWVVSTGDDWREGSIEQRWRLNDDWTEWDFRLGDTIAEIRLLVKQDPNGWQIRCLGETVVARTLWRDNFFEWRLDDGKDRLVWKTRFGNIRDEWVLRNEDRGEFAVYTYWEGDPREWVVYDQMDEGVSYAMRIAMIFIAIFHSSPKL